MDPLLPRLLTVLRLVAFMVLLYLVLGWMVERWSRKPGSKLKAFFRVICGPITGPVARLLPAGAGEKRVLQVSLGLVAGVWVVLIVLSETLGGS